MNRCRIIISLVFVNLGIFVATVAFLPRRSDFSWRSGNPFGFLVNSRAQWDVAWLILFASSLASVGIYLLITARNRNEPPK